MRLIMEFEVSDDCTYSCINTYPIVAESPETALDELEQLVMSATEDDYEFLFCGHELVYEWFIVRVDNVRIFKAPHIFTLDNWFVAAEHPILAKDQRTSTKDVTAEQAFELVKSGEWTWQTFRSWSYQYSNDNLEHFLYETDAWRRRFPQFVYQRQDNIIALKMKFQD